METSPYGWELQQCKRACRYSDMQGGHSTPHDEDLAVTSSHITLPAELASRALTPASPRSERRRLPPATPGRQMQRALSQSQIHTSHDLALLLESMASMPALAARRHTSSTGAFNTCVTADLRSSRQHSSQVSLCRLGPRVELSAACCPHISVRMNAASPPVTICASSFCSATSSSFRSSISMSSGSA